MNRFDSTVLSSLDIAQSEALKRQHTELTPYHLLYGLASNPHTKTAKLIADQIPILEQKIAKFPIADHPVPLDKIRMSADLSAWLTVASGEAAKAGQTEISESALLPFIPKFIKGISLPRELTTAASNKEDSPAFLINLNERAHQGKLDPVIGRTKEIRSVIEILGRRSKNNPVLVGPAGVGKTAIVEGLADQIVKGKVPEVLAGKTVYSLDMGSLMAGTKYRGDFEERLQKLLKFIKQDGGNSILFIDEIHQLVGAGRTDGAMDAANLLKPALARGELHCIGATTPEEFQKYILGDAALERRLRQVRVDEPCREDSIEILMGIRDKHEAHHGIKISDEAIYASVLLSSQYVTDKNLPDKAIDLIDEAASSMKLSAETMPAELEQLGSDIRAKKILAKVEPDNKEIENEIADLENKFAIAKEKWDEDVASLKKAASLKNSLDKARFDLQKAEHRGDFEEASRIKFSVIPELEKSLSSHQHGWILEEGHIASVIARQTGIPVEKILKRKQDKILELEPYLKSRVFGQEEALEEIAKTLVTSFAGLSDQTRPLGSFLLTGPTGVGKTETAKSLAEFLFDSDKNLIRVDLSEFSEKHAVAKLIGAPAGYVGYEEGGVLTEAIRQKPFSVVLFDEIEKAHPDFSDLLLQILDDGRLTDNKGRTADFKNTIILMTTNSKDIELDLKPEVLGRIDARLNYAPLTQGVMDRLIDRQLQLLNQRLKGKRLKVDLSEEARRTLCERGYDPKFGARPLQTVFNRLVNRPLAYRLVEGQIDKGEYIAKLSNGSIDLVPLP